MYYIAKAVQAAGLIIILVDFMMKFPHLMSPRVLLVGVLLWGMGWIINRFMLKS